MQLIKAYDFQDLGRVAVLLKPNDEGAAVLAFKLEHQGADLCPRQFAARYGRSDDDWHRAKQSWRDIDQHYARRIAHELNRMVSAIPGVGCSRPAC